MASRKGKVVVCSSFFCLDGVDSSSAMCLAFPVQPESEQILAGSYQQEPQRAEVEQVQKRREERRKRVVGGGSYRGRQLMIVPSDRA